MNDKERILKIVQAVPGLERMSLSELKLLHPRDVYVMSRDIVRREMKDNLLPFEGKRAHRKSHGMMEFIEMSRMMVRLINRCVDDIGFCLLTL